MAAAGGEHVVEPQPFDRLRLRAEAADEQLGQRAGALAAALRGAEQRQREVVELGVELGQLTGRHVAATANSASPTGGHARRLSAAKACS